MDKNEIIKITENYARLLKKNNYMLRKVYLFGSCAKGNCREDSDIDVAIILDNIDDTQEELIRLMRLRRSIDERIEPHPIEYKSFTEGSPFISEIIRSGIEIKERSL